MGARGRGRNWGGSRGWRNGVPVVHPRLAAGEARRPEGAVPPLRYGMVRDPSAPLGDAPRYRNSSTGLPSAFTVTVVEPTAKPVGEEVEDTNVRGIRVALDPHGHAPGLAKW
jgi:hypothetical protein